MTRDKKLRLLVKAQNNLCFLCDQPLVFGNPENHPDYPTRDHVIPRSFSGENKTRNIVIVHASCNTNKGNSYPSKEFLEKLEKLNIARTELIKEFPYKPALPPKPKNFDITSYTKNSLASKNLSNILNSDEHIFFRNKARKIIHRFSYDINAISNLEYNTALRFLHLAFNEADKKIDDFPENIRTHMRNVLVTMKKQFIRKENT